jgi:Flp pilus assembly protein TadD
MRNIAIFVSVLLLLAGGALAVGVMVGPMSEEKAASAGNDPVFYNELGFKLAQQGDNAAAQKAFAQAVELKPSYERARSNLATIAFQNEDYATAIEQLQVLVQLSPANAGYHFDLAQNLASQARYKDADLAKLLEAGKEFEKANELSPGFPHALENARIVRAVAADFD